ncbi:MAG: hypothetical protein LC650_03235, partial [Actinobacteria bacterium]|nr:hypothetical protein [Actinomycetota bacterium]
GIIVTIPIVTAGEAPITIHTIHIMEVIITMDIMTTIQGTMDTGMVAGITTELLTGQQVTQVAEDTVNITTAVCRTGPPTVTAAE